MYVCVCMSVCVCLWLSVCVSTCAYVCICVCACVCVCVGASVYVCRGINKDLSLKVIVMQCIYTPLSKLSVAPWLIVGSWLTHGKCGMCGHPPKDSLQDPNLSIYPAGFKWGRS